MTAKQLLPLVFSTIFAFFYCSSGTLAAVSPGQIRELQRRQEHIQQQQEERLRIQEREFLSRGESKTPPAEPPPLPHIDSQEGAPCMSVTKISVTGVTLLSDNVIEQITTRYTGRCLALTDINNLLRDISNAYIERGYITARAFVDPAGQEKEERPGFLSILVIEGTVEDIILNDGNKNSYYRGKTAFPGLIGKPLNLRDIEQGLDQLNRVPSASASMELLPGKTLGGTIVKVTNTTTHSFRVGLGFDNNGQSSTGEGMYNLSLEKDNFMGVGDQFAVYWSENLPVWDEQIRGKKGMGNNRAFSAYMSIPYGYWTFSANLSRSEYDTKVYGLNSIYKTRGETDVNGLKVERVVHRDQNSKTSVSLGYAYRSVDTYFENILLDSSYKLSTMEAGIAHSRRIWGGVLNAAVGVTRGLRAFGATNIENYAYSTPKSSFTKYTSSISWYRPFMIGEESFYWSTTAYGQVTGETLYGAERVQIGGRYSVRGFKNDSLSGDQGGYVTNEIGWNVPWASFETGPVRGMQVYAGYDVGALHRDSRDPFERGTMQGAALGIRTLGDLSLDASVAKSLAHPSFVKTKDMECYVALKYTF